MADAGILAVETLFPELLYTTFFVVVVVLFFIGLFLLFFLLIIIIFVCLFVFSSDFLHISRCHRAQVPSTVVIVVKL